MCMLRLLCPKIALSTGYFRQQRTGLNLRGRIWGLLACGSMMVHRVRSFAVVNTIGFRGVSVVTADFPSSQPTSYALMAWDPDEGGGAFPVVYSLANRPRVMCATLNAFK